MGIVVNGWMRLTTPGSTETLHVTARDNRRVCSSRWTYHHHRLRKRLCPQKRIEKELELKSDQASRTNCTSLHKERGPEEHVKYAVKRQNPVSGKFYRTSKLVSSTSKLSERGGKKRTGEWKFRDTPTKHTVRASSAAGPKRAGEMGKLAGEGMMLRDDY